MGIDSKLLTIIGSPSSGKSTLASSIHTELKKNGRNSIFIGEVATDYIAEYGIPNTPIDQMTIFYKQTTKERMFIGKKEFIICDSSGILNYFYFRRLFKTPLSSKDVAVINHLQKEILKTINQWRYIFYVPMSENIENDNIRISDINEIRDIDNMIKYYLKLENIPHIDLSDIPLEERTDYVMHIIK